MGYIVALCLLAPKNSRAIRECQSVALANLVFVRCGT